MQTLSALCNVPVVDLLALTSNGVKSAQCDHSFRDERRKEPDMERLTKFRMLGLLFGLVTAFAVGTLITSAGRANADEPGNNGFGQLVNPGPGLGSWLPDHYDNRSGQVMGGPAFDDSAEVIFVGEIAGIGKVTVEQSAAWTFTTFRADGAGPCGLVYDSARTLVRIHTHAGTSTENVSGPLTLIPGSSVNDPGGISAFPFSAAGVGANGLNVGTHTFTGTFTVTRKDGSTITGIVEGGSACVVAVFSTVGGHPPAGVFDFTHIDSIVTVQTALEIMDGTGKFAGASGTGVLVYSHDIFEPHGLLNAHIVLELD